ncbi:MAG TPA: DUF4124 domain-containing protein [Xanthomonadaceae bacterium]|nr:DUF4124 domain-containing protein [Xanthomonadaceae bacterium]
MSHARPFLTIATCIALFAGATAQAADKVYKWTDADGVTHYGDAPPPQGEFESSTIDRAAREARGAPGATAAAGAAPGEDPLCARMRSQLALLVGDSPVQQDTDGDGKADRILSQADREAQAALARKLLDTDCAAPGA